MILSKGRLFIISHIRMTYLVKENIFAIAGCALSRMLLQVSICADSMFLAQLLPKLTAD